MTQSQNYASYSDKQKLDFLKENYINKNLSMREVAKTAGVSLSTIKRECQRLGVPARDKSQAQQLALETGRHKHPTKGSERDDKTKERISNTMYNKWQSEINREERSEMSKRLWNSLDPLKRQSIQQKGFEAIKETSKTGSKLEKYLLEELPKHGYRTSFHHEKMLGGTALQVDLMIEDMGVAIEVNGPSHREAIWGNKSFERSQRADITKRALLENYGFVLIVITHNKALSKKRKEIILGNLLAVLSEARLPNHKMFYEVKDEECQK